MFRSVGQSPWLSDTFFPFFDTLTSITSVPEPVSIIGLLYLSFQIVSLSFWFEIDDFWGDLEWVQQWRLAAFWSNVSPDLSASLIASSIVCIFSAVLGGFLLIFNFRYYVRTRRLIEEILSISMSFIDVISNICFLPCAVLASRFFLVFRNDGADPVAILLFVLAILSFLVHAACFLVSKLFLARTVYRRNVITFNFDFRPHVCLSLFVPIFAVLAPLFAVFPVWTHYFLWGTHLLFNAALLWVFDFGPYLSVFTNSLLFAMFVAPIFSDLFRIAGFAVDRWIFPLVLGVIFAASYAGFVVFSHVLARRIRRQLAYDGAKNLSELPRLERCAPTLYEEERLQLFARRDVTLRHWRKYLLVGVQSACDMFIDFTLFKFYLNKDPQDDLLCVILHLMAYFPRWMKQLDDLHRRIRRSRSLSASHMFLVFQIYRIKVQGQTAREAGSSTKLGSIKLESGNLEGRMRSFWTAPDVPLGELLRFGTKRHFLESEWQEILRLNTLNTSYHEDYLRFLVEACSDFRSALVVKARLDYLMDDKIRKTDLAFVSFLQVFPQYVTKSIMTIRGHVIDYSAQGGALDDDEDLEGPSLDTITADMAMGSDGHAGDRLLKYGHVSLMLNQVLASRKADSHHHFLGYALISLVGSIICLSILFGILISYFESVESGGNLLISSLEFPQQYASLALAGLMEFARVDHRLPGRVAFPEMQMSAWESASTNFQLLGWDFLITLEDAFETLITGLSWLTDKAVTLDWRLKVNAGSLDPNAMSTFCSPSGDIRQGQSPLMEAVGYQVARLTRLLIATEDWTQFFQSTDWCTIINTSPEIAREFGNAFGVFLEQTLYFYTTFDATVKILMIVIPLVIMAVLYLGFPIVTIRFIRELESFIELLHSIDADSKEQARNPILRALTSLNAATGAQRTTSSDKGFALAFSLGIFLAQGFVAGAATLLLWRARAVGHTYLVFQQWRYHSGIRRSKAYLMCIYTFNAVFSAKIPSSFTNPSKSRDVVIQLSAELDQHAAQLRMEDDSHAPIAGHDAILDYWVLGAGCPDVTDPKTIHDVYNCSGGSHLARIFLSLATTVLDNVDGWNGTLDGAEPSNMIHLLSMHFDAVLAGTAARIDELTAAERAQFTGEMVGIYIAGLVAAAMTFGIAYAFLDDLHVVYGVLLSLLQRLPPAAIVSYGPLRDYVLGKQRLAARTGMSTAQLIVHGSRDGIILASRQGTIDYLNPAVSEILGHSPEELLGQQAQRLFEENQRGEMESQMKLLQDRQLGSEMCERTVLCRTSDEARFVLCHVTVLALYDNDHRLSDFVFIVKDISEDHERELESQKAKEKSEHLLCAIIPRSIAARMKAGTDPTFVVPTASVMFIDIVKFSEFSRNLTPEQIMGTLASIFGSFDERVAQWNLLTKIKLIGDVYMCAAGLFDEAKPASAAEEIVLCALDCLQCLDDQNMKMDIALSVRIGINTGGPIIAGVLGNENRVFDIIGDAINVAARLQSTSMPNTIQLSTSTQEYVAARHFPLQRKDNVVLKGKEEAVSTYLLTNEGSHSFTSGG